MERTSSAARSPAVTFSTQPPPPARLFDISRKRSERPPNSGATALPTAASGPNGGGPGCSRSREGAAPRPGPSARGGGAGAAVAVGDGGVAEARLRQRGAVRQEGAVHGLLGPVDRARQGQLVGAPGDVRIENDRPAR